MKRLVPEDMETGILEIDRYIEEQIGGFIEAHLDEAAFFDALGDCEDLSPMGLQGKLIEQTPEFTLKIVGKEIEFYHMFLLYNNEAGVHLIIPEKVTTIEEKLYLQEELDK